jgi:hypothetical protein
MTLGWIRYQKENGADQSFCDLQNGIPNGDFGSFMGASLWRGRHLGLWGW